MLGKRGQPYLSKAGVDSSEKYDLLHPAYNRMKKG